MADPTSRIDALTFSAFDTPFGTRTFIWYGPGTPMTYIPAGLAALLFFAYASTLWSLLRRRRLPCRCLHYHEIESIVSTRATNASPLPVHILLRLVKL